MPTRKPATPRKTAVKKGPVRRTAAKRAPAHGDVVVPAPKPHKVIRRTYIFAVGRRKEAVARVRWTAGGEGAITVNQRSLQEYFPTFELQQTVRGPLIISQNDQTSTVSVKVAGGGIQGQAEAVRLGIARALVKHDSDLRIPLKRAGFLRRDPRVKERKKYGLKRARRAPQWQKR